MRKVMPLLSASTAKTTLHHIIHDPVLYKSNFQHNNACFTQVNPSISQSVKEVPCKIARLVSQTYHLRKINSLVKFYGNQVQQEG